MPLLSFPNTGEPTVSVVPLADARKNVGVFVRSKNSARNCRAARSIILMFLNAEKSVFTDPGPRATCRAELPKSEWERRMAENGSRNVLMGH